MTAEVERLMWDQGNRRHLAAHGITEQEAEALVFSGMAVSADREGYPSQLRATGPTAGGRWITVVLEPRPEQGIGVWRVITGWTATRQDIEDYFEQSGD